MSFTCLPNCGQCCGPVPIPEKLYRRKRSKHQRQSFPRSFGLGVVLPITKDHYCVFLKPDKTCAVHAHRPQICRDYGVIEQLPCPYVRPDGEQRPPLEVEEHLQRADRQISSWLQVTPATGGNQGVTP